MASVLVHLSLCILTVIPLTVAQSTYDDAGICEGSCGHSEEMLSQLMVVNSQLTTAVSQLQRDVAEMKTGKRRKDMRGEL